MNYAYQGAHPTSSGCQLLSHDLPDLLGRRVPGGSSQAAARRDHSPTGWSDHVPGAAAGAKHYGHHPDGHRRWKKWPAALVLAHGPLARWHAVVRVAAHSPGTHACRALHTAHAALFGVYPAPNAVWRTLWPGSWLP